MSCTLLPSVEIRRLTSVETMAGHSVHLTRRKKKKSSLRSDDGQHVVSTARSRGRGRNYASGTRKRGEAETEKEISGSSIAG